MRYVLLVLVFVHCNVIYDGFLLRSFLPPCFSFSFKGSVTAYEIFLRFSALSLQNISSAAHKLAMNVMKSVGIKIEPNLSLFLTSIFENDLHNYKEIIFNIYQCAPQIFRSIMANLTLEVQVRMR